MKFATQFCLFCLANWVASSAVENISEPEHGVLLQTILNLAMQLEAMADGDVEAEDTYTAHGDVESVVTEAKSSMTPAGDPPSWVQTLGQHEEHVYSQNGEDGIIREILKHVNVPSKSFVEFGCQSGKEINTRLLAENGWTGLLLDGGFENPAINLQKEFIKEETIVDLFRKYNVPEAFGLLSVDIDSYDFWVTKAILEAGFKPAVLINEVNSQVAVGLFTVAPASVTGLPMMSPEVFEFGASPEAMSALVQKHGYATLYCDARGVNCFHVRKDLLDDQALSQVPVSPRRLPRYIDGDNVVCRREAHQPPVQWYELSPSDLSVLQEDAKPGRIAECRADASR